MVYLMVTWIRCNVATPGDLDFAQNQLLFANRINNDNTTEDRRTNDTSVAICHANRSFNMQLKEGGSSARAD